MKRLILKQSMIDANVIRKYAVPRISKVSTQHTISDDVGEEHIKRN